MAHQIETPSPAPAASPPVGVGRVFEAPPTPPETRPEADRRRWLRLGIIVAELGAVLYALQVFRIEETFGFGKLLPLIFVGFVVHTLLPLRLRQPFFVLISTAAIGGVLGFVHGMALILLGLTLLGICHLPIGFAYRVGVVLAAAALLAAVRLEWISAPLPELATLVLPILGSMFMFRLIIYLYDLRHEHGQTSLWQRLSYFFLLPNVCFPLFPVVDYQRFRSTYYDTDAEAIYQKGLNWIVRGLVQLLIYRAVYYHLVPTAAEVVGLGGVVQSMVSTYLLYLRISGQFHMIVGILCLFGFNLPETHHAYLLASSFNDYWRRINIYWKDFMMKIFYYPSLMRLKRYGLQPAMVGATLVVFAGTWILHSYQWLWLRGTFPITVPDALFWGILGGLVVVNSLWEARRGRRRALSRPHWSLPAATAHALQVTAMLVTITVLWSLWSSGSLSQWLELVGSARGVSAISVAALFGALALLVALGVAAQYLRHRGWPLTPLGDRPSFGRSVVVSGGTALTLVLVGLPSIQSTFTPQVATAIASLQDSRLNARDAEALERGYYEGLLDAENFASALWRVSPQRQPGDWLGVREAGAVIWTHDLLEFELIPSFQVTILRIPFHTNRWGMRDREYTQAKPPGTYRIALLGASHTMGAGVAAEEIFESLTEERLNREMAAELGTRFEILNFAVAGYTAHQSAIQALNKLSAFQPDAVFYTAHSNERTRTVRRLAIAVQAGHPIPYPELAEIVARSGATAGMSRGEVERRLATVGNDVLAWSFRTMVSAARAMGAVPVWIYVPVVEADDLASPRRLRRLAEEAGFIIWDLGGTYAGHDPSELRLATWDTHPNARGHLLLSQALYARLTESLPELMGER